MRAASLLVVLIACKKAEPPPPKVTPAPVLGDAAVAIAEGGVDAPGGAKLVDIELIRVTAAQVRVSSQVANPKILPEHLVDRDLGTAWNSVTGELVGAWIHISAIPGAEIHELRITPGFTAKGPKGEDWFTMNPRIKKLEVMVDSAPAGSIVLDPEKRELQSFPVRAKSLRLEVLEIVPGTKKAWREASMSELEVWGTPPSGWTPPSPLPPIVVYVGTGEPIEPDDPCAAIGKDREEFEDRHKDDMFVGPGAEDHAYPPKCSSMETTLVGQLAAWATPTKAWCYVQDEIYGPQNCTLVFANGSDKTQLEIQHDAAIADIAATLEMREVIAASVGRELVVQFSVFSTQTISVCRTDPDLRCSEQIIVADTAFSDPWTATVTFEKGAVKLVKATGNPPPDALGVHPLVFK